VLDGEDLHEYIVNMIKDFVNDSVNMYVQGDIADDWNLVGLKERLNGLLTNEDDFNYTSEQMDELTRDKITDILMERANKIYAAREEELGSELLHEIERVCLLKVVDTKWMDHIDDMEELKRGISLRSYGQKNPVVEYRMEGMDMFDAMIESIREDTVRMLFTIKVRQQAAPQRQEVLKPMEHHNMTVRNKKKVGRNDPCPCGSGKKYKDCCGKN
jgi:Preprotein translocase subunit SecA (ATPase, RNA helicase)